MELILDDVYERKRYIDLLKGIGIILVIAEHWMGTYNQAMSNWICSFHMPLFFVLGGVLYKRREFDAFLYRKLRTLLVPYLFYKAFFTVMQLIFIPLPESLEKSFSYVFSFGGGWFILSFFYVSLLFCIIESRFKSKIGMVIVILSAYVFGLIVSACNIAAVETIAKQTFVGLFYYMMGYLLNSYQVQSFLMTKKVLSIILGVSALCVLVLFFFWRNDYMVGMYCNDYGDILTFIIKSVISCIAVLAIGIIINKCVIVEKIGRLSLPIMVIQFPLYRGLRPITNRLIGIGYSGMIFDTVCVGFITIVSFFMAWMLDKKYPFITGHKI